MKVIPLWSTAITMSINIGGSFGLLQAKSLDRHIISSSNFQVPPGSFSVILIVAILIWIIIYDRVLIPLASKIRGKPVIISPKTRMGIGLCFNFLHMTTAAIFETVRRKEAIKEGYLNDSHGVLKMSAMWLAPQLCLGGISEAFNVIGQNEFYYKEFPKSMASVAASLSGLAMGVGNLVSSLVLSIIESTTPSGGNEGWVSDNINKGHFDKYYWVIVGLNALNLLYYLVCSWAYGPTVDEVSNVSEENGSKEENSTELKNVNPQIDDKVSDETSSKEKELTEFKKGGQVEKVFKNSEQRDLKEEDL